MNEIVGIDLGTTNSLIGIMESGFPILIADANGSRLTPSVVYFPNTGMPLVGQQAAHFRGLQPAETVYSIKRLIGLRGDELRPDDDTLPFQIERRLGHPVCVIVNGNSYSPEELSALVLQKLKTDAEIAMGHPVSRAVISVPAYFNDAQRTATKRAG